MSMSYVVGDKFDRCTKLKSCITYSEFLEKYRNRELDVSIQNGIQYYPGQGLQEEQIKVFLKEIEGRKLSKHFYVWYHMLSNYKASEKLTHKRYGENRLITEPQNIAIDTYEMDLVINDKNEIMSDHVTGYHLQGMLLIEAARQSFLAVTEKYFVPKELDFKSYFVIKKMEVNFISFVFPFDTKIVYNILDKDIKDPLKLNFSICVGIHQMDQIATSIDIDFSVFHKPWFETIEQKKAERCLLYYMQKYSDENNANEFSASY